MTVPARLSRVCWAIDELKFNESFKRMGFKYNDIYLFLGEIEGMPGHCAFVDAKGRTYWGYHTDNFKSADSLDFTLEV